jgi:hypothetical protein
VLMHMEKTVVAGGGYPHAAGDPSARVRILKVEGRGGLGVGELFLVVKHDTMDG